jgi:hypothetical protein
MKKARFPPLYRSLGLRARRQLQAILLIAFDNNTVDGNKNKLYILEFISQELFSDFSETTALSHY